MPVNLFAVRARLVQSLAATFPAGSFNLVTAAYLHSPAEFPWSEILADVDLDFATPSWRVETNEVVTRTAERDGKPLTRDDNILRLTRLL